MTRIRLPILVLSAVLLLAGCKKASQTAHEMADQTMYKPVVYANASVPGPEIVVLPGAVQGAHLTFRQKVGANNIADFAEMELEKDGFKVLERANLDAMVDEISLAANLGDADALRLFKVGKFRAARCLVRFDLIKAEQVSQTSKSFDGTLAGVLIGGIVGGLTDNSSLGTATGATIASIKSGESVSVWKAGMRYVLIDAVTGQQIATGEVEETIDVRKTLQGFLGSTEEKGNMLPMDALTLRMIQTAVARIDAEHKAALAALPAVAVQDDEPEAKPGKQAKAAPAPTGRGEQAIRQQYEELKQKRKQEQEAAAYAARFEGVYAGQFSGGTKGQITLTVSGDKVEGVVSNADGLQGTFTGPLNVDSGSMDCDLAGNISIVKFTGKVTGSLTDSQASGDWTASGWGTEKGVWQATRQ